MKVLDLFSGIGGFSLGLERAGFETVAFCEIDPFCRKVLRKHWPEVPIHEDIKELDGTQHRGTVDVVCGGFPCQDVSVAGRRSGFDGERSSLYSEMLRVVGECKPRYVIFENVTGLLTGQSGRWFAQFLYDLAEIGLNAEWHCISASYIGAPHHRDRVWVIACPSSNNGDASTNEESRKQRGESAQPHFAESFKDAANANDQRCEGRAKIANHLKKQIELMRGSEVERGRFNLSQPALCGADDGVSNRSHRLRSLGNAVVPQIPEIIGLAILEAEK